MFEKLLFLIIGAVIGAVLKHDYEKKSKLFEKKQERYFCIILLMKSFIDFDNSINKLQRHRPNITSKKDLFEEIEDEYDNMVLFASENVLLKTNEFIKNPTRLAFIQVGIAMKKDLWGLKTSKKFKKLLESY